jgi:hypothetical protein
MRYSGLKVYSELGGGVNRAEENISRINKRCKKKGGR